MSEEDYPDKRSDHCFYADNLNNLRLDNVSVEWDEENTEPKWGSALFIKNVKNLAIRDFTGRQGLIDSDLPVIHLKNVANHDIKRVALDEGAGEELKIEN